jgi:uncharacterized protein (TIGR03067 family)
MKWLIVIGVALVLIANGTGAADKPDEKKADAEKVRGAWKVVSAEETAGLDKNVEIPEYKDTVWTFGETEFAVTRGKVETKFAYRLDPSAKPKQIDFGKDLAGKGDQRPFEGIYELDGDKLTICYTVLNARPTDFSMGKGIAAIKRLVVLKREPVKADK